MRQGTVPCANSSDWTYNETSHWHACVDEGYTDLKKDEGAHTMDAGTVTASATCTENGTTVYKCTVCGMTQEKTIQKLGHSWSDWQSITDATGLVTVGKQRTCATCGKVEKQTSSGASQFVDVSESSFYATPVAWAVEQGITNGTDKTHFSPESPCTRGQVVTFLWRAAGEPAPQSGNNPFADVKKSDYFYTAVIWAVENGITTGTSSTKFSPNEPCTRGQVVTFQYRSNNEPEVNGKCDFTDVKSSDYFYNAVLWAVANGITNGTSAKTFSPQATCTRGQIVTFLFRDFSK
ncbi:MAG: S-layer homology domain-containing protein [Faecousia sp.]|nr:S-layer homology domain-containing protein [Bacillota bacterium]